MAGSGILEIFLAIHAMFSTTGCLESHQGWKVQKQLLKNTLADPGNGQGGPPSYF